MIPPPGGFKTREDTAAWYDYDKGDRKWTEEPPLANPIFVRNWRVRTAVAGV